MGFHRSNIKNTRHLNENVSVKVAELVIETVGFFTTWAIINIKWFISTHYIWL